MGKNTKRFCCNTYLEVEKPFILNILLLEELKEQKSCTRIAAVLCSHHNSGRVSKVAILRSLAYVFYLADRVPSRRNAFPLCPTRKTWWMSRLRCETMGWAHQCAEKRRRAGKHK